MYQINQLSFSYETKEVLKNISVTFPTNKITAIIGPDVVSLPYLAIYIDFIQQKTKSH